MKSATSLAGDRQGVVVWDSFVTARVMQGGGPAAVADETRGWELWQSCGSASPVLLIVSLWSLRPRFLGFGALLQWRLAHRAGLRAEAGALLHGALVGRYAEACAGVVVWWCGAGHHFGTMLRRSC